ncbi:hypothetical protein BMS3Bbin04_00307 [bacterium BMS3Bbin04]|nr:hypothetical protein BMS3Bbin04_00307 [bacterium BMS3Bbin04]
MEALLQQFVAYNLDLGDYTSADMLNAFTQDSDFMSLEADGSSRMQSALAAWARAATHIDDGLTFLKNEVDDQANDLIRIDPYEGLTQEDIEDIEDGLEQIIDGLTGTAEIEVEIDDEMVLLDMSAYNFFGTPVENIKALLPAYTVELDLDPDGRPDWDDMVQVEEGNVAVVLTVNDPGNYYWYKQGEYYRGEEEYVSDWITGEIPELDIEYNTRVTEYEDENYVMIYVTFSGYLEAGVNEVFAYVEVMTGDVPYRYVPVFTWEADRGEDWILPDPTFGGLLPGMTDSEFKDLIDWTPDDFEKTFTMHIWDMFDWD